MLDGVRVTVGVTITVKRSYSLTRLRVWDRVDVRRGEGYGWCYDYG